MLMDSLVLSGIQEALHCRLNQMVTFILFKICFQGHLPQAYDDRFMGFCNLDRDLVIEAPTDGSVLKIDVRFTPISTPKESDVKKALPAVALANPGPMALYAFTFTTLMLMLIETGAVEHSSVAQVIGYAMFHGGLVQLVVGFIEIFRNNLFGAVAFTGYGAFWMGWALTEIFKFSEVLGPVEDFPKAKTGYLIIWGVFTAALFVQTLYINYCLQAIFLLLTLTFLLLAGGVYNPVATTVAGYVGIALTIVVFYTATAELYNDLGHVTLPLFHVRGARKEFGNSKPGRGEILTPQDPAGIVPLRARSDGPQAGYKELGEANMLESEG